MKLTIPSHRLKQAFTVAANFVESTGLYSNVLLKVHEGMASIAAHNLGSGHAVLFPLGSVTETEDGTVLIGHAQMMRLIASIDIDFVRIATKGDRIEIKYRKSRWDLATHSPDVFNLPDFVTTETTTEIDAAHLIDVAERLSILAAKADVRHALEGVFIGKRAGRDRPVFIATDGFKGAAITVPEQFDPTPDTFAAIVPAKQFGSLKSALDPESGHVAVAVRNNDVVLTPAGRTDNPTIVYRQVQGNFPQDYDRWINPNPLLSEPMAREDWVSAINQCLVVAPDNVRRVKITLSGTSIRFHAVDSEKGQGDVEIGGSTSDWSHDEVTFGVAADHFLPLLKSLKEDVFQIGFNTDRNRKEITLRSGDFVGMVCPLED